MVSEEKITGKVPVQKYDSKRAGEVEKTILIKQILQMPDLPTPSPVIMKLVQLLKYEDVEMKVLIDTISHDQSLVAQILKLINSGFYSVNKKINSVETAVTMLGLANLKQVIYSATVIDLFGADEKAEWEHAYTTSVLMNKIIKENDLPVAPSLPLTVLIHDIGKVVLRKFRPQKYKIAILNSSEKNIPLFMAENSIIGINHGELGATLTEKWKMTPDIIIPVQYHHSKDVPQEFILETALLKFVNWVDCTIREIPLNEPEREIMEASGIEEIDKEYWLSSQREVICNVHNENMLEKTDTKKLKRAPK